jgi:hypothetical protein
LRRPSPACRHPLIDGFANLQRRKKGASVAASYFLPVTIRGEMPGRAMRGSAKIDDWGVVNASWTHHGALPPPHDSALNLCYAPRFISGTMLKIGRKPLILAQP